MVRLVWQLLVASTCLLLLAASPARAATSTVSTDADGGWVLLIDGEPTTLQGVGVARATGKTGVDYLQLAAKLGANAVRTWGLKHTTRRYLDRASTLGLKVNAGVWLPHTRASFSYAGATTQELDALQANVLAQVEAQRLHPAIFMWTVGNEVLHNAPDDRERVAFVAFLQRLVSAIKRIEPSRVVTYAAAGAKQLHHLRNVPALDLIGVNLYGNPAPVWGALEKAGERRPLLFTELGPRRTVDMSTDENGLHVVPADAEKANRYLERMDAINSRAKRHVGMFVYRLGDPRLRDMHWMNLSFGRYPRAAFSAIAKRYGAKATYATPLCALSGVQPKPYGEMQISINVRSDTSARPLRYAAQWRKSTDDKRRDPMELLYPRSHSTGEFVIHAPQRPGLYWLAASVVDPDGGACLMRKSVRIPERERSQ